MLQLPSSFKAAAIEREESGFHFKIVDVPFPKLAADEILLKLSVSGICGTDIGLASGEIGPTCEILGHEGVGRVVAVGSGISQATAKLQDRVAICWIRDICGKCAACLRPGGETRCRAQKNSGRHVDGTFAEYAIVPSTYVIRIPQEINVADELVAPVLCGGVTAYKALIEANVDTGQWVAVFGAGGGVGAFVLQYARAFGLRPIAMDFGIAKSQYCLEMGAEAFIDVIQTSDVPAEVSRITGSKGVSAAIVSANSIKAYQTALECLDIFATLVCVGIPQIHERFELHPIWAIDKGIKIVGSAVGTRGDILGALSFVSRGVVKPHIERIKLEDLDSVTHNFDKLAGKYVIQFDSSRQSTESFAPGNGPVNQEARI